MGVVHNEKDGKGNDAWNNALAAATSGEEFKASRRAVVKMMENQMKPNITIDHEIQETQSGNFLVKHPANIVPRQWNRITVAWIASGQPRRYADSVYEAHISFEGGCGSTQTDFDLPFGTGMGIEQIKKYVQLHIHSFDEPPQMGGGELVTLELVERGKTYSVWHAKVVVPYMD